MTEPLLCSQGGVPYNKAHLDAKDAEITRICRAMTAVVEENERLRAALDESVKLQSHYATILNDYDGGKRMQFADGAAWIERLRGLEQNGEDAQRSDK